MNKKKVVVKKKSNPFTETLKFFGVSLFSNQTCVSGRKRPWYLALFAFFFAIILALVPQVVQISNQKGSAFLYSTTYDADLGLEAFTNTLNNEDINLVTYKDALGKNRFGFNTVADSEKWTALTAQTGGHFEYKKLVSGTEATTEVRFKVFLAFGKTDGNTNAYLLLHDEKTGINSTLTKPEEGAADNGYVKPVSYAIFGDEEIFIVIYAPDKVIGKNYNAFYTGDYSNIPATENSHVNLKNLMKTDLFDTNSPNATSVLDSAWITFLNNGYVNVRNLLLITTISIMGTIFIFVNIVFGLSIFLMTRGKNNPNRDIKIGDAYKIGAFAATAPALLAMIIGLFAPSMNSIAYLALYGLRVMWMSMRTLRPMTQ